MISNEQISEFLASLRGQLLQLSNETLGFQRKVEYTLTKDDGWGMADTPVTVKKHITDANMRSILIELDGAKLDTNTREQNITVLKNILDKCSDPCARALMAKPIMLANGRSVLTESFAQRYTPELMLKNLKTELGHLKTFKTDSYSAEQDESKARSFPNLVKRDGAYHCSLPDDGDHYYLWPAKKIPCCNRYHYSDAKVAKLEKQIREMDNFIKNKYSGHIPETLKENLAAQRKAMAEYPELMSRYGGTRKEPDHPIGLSFYTSFADDGLYVPEVHIVSPFDNTPLPIDVKIENDWLADVHLKIAQWLRNASRAGIKAANEAKKARGGAKMSTTERTQFEINYYKTLFEALNVTGDGEFLTYLPPFGDREITLPKPDPSVATSKKAEREKKKAIKAKRAAKRKAAKAKRDAAKSSPDVSTSVDPTATTTASSTASTSVTGSLFIPGGTSSSPSASATSSTSTPAASSSTPSDPSLLFTEGPSGLSAIHIASSSTPSDPSLFIPGGTSSSPSTDPKSSSSSLTGSAGPDKDDEAAIEDISDVLTSLLKSSSKPADLKDLLTKVSATTDMSDPKAIAATLKSLGAWISPPTSLVPTGSTTTTSAATSPSTSVDPDATSISDADLDAHASRLVGDIVAGRAPALLKSLQMAWPTVDFGDPPDPYLLHPAIIRKFITTALAATFPDPDAVAISSPSTLSTASTASPSSPTPVTTPAPDRELLLGDLVMSMLGHQVPGLYHVLKTESPTTDFDDIESVYAAIKDHLEKLDEDGLPIDDTLAKYETDHTVREAEKAKHEAEARAKREAERAEREAEEAKLLKQEEDELAKAIRLSEQSAKEEAERHKLTASGTSTSAFSSGTASTPSTSGTASLFSGTTTATSSVTTSDTGYTPTSSFSSPSSGPKPPSGSGSGSTPSFIPTSGPSSSGGGSKTSSGTSIPTKTLHQLLQELQTKRDSAATMAHNANLNTHIDELEAVVSAMNRTATSRGRGILLRALSTDKTEVVNTLKDMVSRTNQVLGLLRAPTKTTTQQTQILNDFNDYIFSLQAKYNTPKQTRVCPPEAWQKALGAMLIILGIVTAIACVGIALATFGLLAAPSALTALGLSSTAKLAIAGTGIGLSIAAGAGAGVLLHTKHQYDRIPRAMQAIHDDVAEDVGLPILVR